VIRLRIADPVDAGVVIDDEGEAYANLELC